MNSDKQRTNPEKDRNPQERKPAQPKPDWLVDFPAWLDKELEELVASYDGFSTSNSRKGFYGR